MVMKEMVEKLDSVVEMEVMEMDYTVMVVQDLEEQFLLEKVLH